MQEKLTGYPSIDKPWLKYYSKDDKNRAIPQDNMYELIWKSNRDYLSNNAVEFFNKHITYQALFDTIDTLAKSFWASGIRKGDIVTIIAITTPEILCAIYALNRLGAVCSCLYPNMSDDIIKAKVQITNSKHIILLDLFADKANSFKSDKSISIYLFRFSQSMSALGKLALLFKKTPKTEATTISYNQLLSTGKNATPDYTENNPEDIALIMYSGGTTGEPKGIILTNKNANAVSSQQNCSLLDLKREYTWQSVAAPFITYTLIYATHLPLSYGMECKIVVYDPKEIAKHIASNKNYFVSITPMNWELLIHDKSTRKANLSNLIDPITGADYMSPELENEINAFFRAHGSKAVMSQGYGMTEVASAVCRNYSTRLNKMGSVGIPFKDTLISAFDPNTNQELKSGETGEICISGPNVMLGYFNNKEATEEMIKKHSDGKMWLHSGDLGHIDEDGFVFIDGRLKRMFVRHDGVKVFAPYIEKIIMQVEAVQRCCVIGTKEPNYDTGKAPFAFILLKEEYFGQKENIKRALLEHCQKSLPEYEVPVDFSFIREVPVTSANKVDFKALEKQAEEMNKQQD